MTSSWSFILQQFTYSLKRETAQHHRTQYFCNLFTRHNFSQRAHQVYYQWWTIYSHYIEALERPVYGLLLPQTCPQLRFQIPEHMDLDWNLLSSAVMRWTPWHSNTNPSVCPSQIMYTVKYKAKVRKASKLGIIQGNTDNLTYNKKMQLDKMPYIPHPWFSFSWHQCWLQHSLSWLKSVFHSFSY